MNWSEEDLAQMIERRSALLGMIAHRRGASPVFGREAGEQIKRPALELAELKRQLAQVEALLAESGLTFPG